MAESERGQKFVVSRYMDPIMGELPVLQDELEIGMREIATSIAFTAMHGEPAVVAHAPHVRYVAGFRHLLGGRNLQLGKAVEIEFIGPLVVGLRLNDWGNAELAFVARIDTSVGRI